VESVEKEKENFLKIGKRDARHPVTLLVPQKEKMEEWKHAIEEAIQAVGDSGGFFFFFDCF